MAAAKTLSIEELTVVRSSKTIIDSLSFSLGPGELLGLLGPSGSGKTTLIRSALGLQRITGGSISVLGQAPGSASTRSSIGYMAQGGSIYLDLSVEENVAYFCRMLGLPAEEVARVIATVDLVRHRRSLVSRLSGGERARVSLAIALLGSPPLLLLDEPTVGLDPILRHDLWLSFKQLAAEGTSLVITSHVMDEAAHCDRLSLLRSGQLVFDGSPAKLLERTGEPGYDTAFIKLIERAAT